MKFSWSDFPKHIIKLISSKLSSKSRQISSHLPWTIYLQNSEELALFNPCSQEVQKFSNSIGKHKYRLNINFDSTTVYASKYGWLLISCQEFISLLLYNPFFGDEIIKLPKLCFEHCRAATFTTEPHFSDCEVLVLCSHSNSEKLYLAQYCMSARVKEWKIKHIGTMSCSSHCQVHYMAGKLYCIFSNGVFKSYNLIDQSVNSLSNLPGFDANQRVERTTECWLTENGGNIVAVCKKPNSTNCKFEWLIYIYDWLLNNWMFDQKGLRNMAIFISGRVAITLPLADNDGKVEKGYVCHFQEGDGYGVEIYSLKKIKTVLSKQYQGIKTVRSLSFIEAPPLVD